MKRRMFLMSLAGAAGCRRGPARLNVFNWSTYIAPEALDNFERETGIRVRYGVYESNEEMLARVLSGNSGWDVVFPSHYCLAPMRRQGLLAPLRHEWLPHLDQLEPEFRKPSWDPELRWCVPYLWGATGILYHRKLSPPPESWASMWEARMARRVTMLNDPAEVLGAALKKLGYSVNATEQEQLRQAQREALAQKPLLRAYLNAEVLDQVVAGDVVAAQAWSSAAQQAMDENEELRFAYPAEGFPLYADNAVVLRESRRAEAAHRFIDYLLRPEVAALNHRTARSASCIRLPEELKRNRVLYPPAEVLARGEWWTTPPAAVQRLRDRLWTEILSG
ncbi:MAG: spermidine/putrescine ABC transporter substrate-binding protein [Bryobacteraceae bacterium]|nr:spermidine/putrescine ABC transporter substrate-binding protein [Bryobacteraceae bacterium]